MGTSGTLAIRNDGARRLQAVHARHLHVHEHQIVRSGRSALKRLDRLRTVPHAIDGRPCAADQLFGDLTHDLVVLGQKNARIRPGTLKLRKRIAPAALRLSTRNRGRVQPASRAFASLVVLDRQQQREARSAPAGALHVDGASHAFHQALRYSHAKPGALF